MLKRFAALLILLAAVPFAGAADLLLDFSGFAPGQSPTGYVSTVTGLGKPGEWKMVEDDVPSSFKALSPQGAATNKRRVLAQLSQDATDEHFPLFIYQGETFQDFSLTTKFKCVSGETEQMAGIAFRIQDEKNYYIVRASAKGKNLRFYKFVNGQRSAPIGPEVAIAAGEWHELGLSCKANEIKISLDGKEIMPPLKDNSFQAGKIGYWTKSDSVAHFIDTRITYTRREPYAQKVLQEVLEDNPRLLGLTVYAYKNDKLQSVASSDPKKIGLPGGATEESVIKEEKYFTQKGIDDITVIAPLRDRNGDAVAAVHIVLKSFIGQTANNAIGRSLPITKLFSSRIQTAKEFVE